MVNFVDDNKTTMSHSTSCSPKNKNRGKNKPFGYRRKFRNRRGRWKRKLEGDMGNEREENTGSQNENDEDTEDLSEKEEGQHDELEDNATGKTDRESTGKEDQEDERSTKAGVHAFETAEDKEGGDTAKEETKTLLSESNSCVGENVLPNGTGGHSMAKIMEQGDLSREEDECMMLSDSEVCNYDDGDVAILSDIDTPIAVLTTYNDEETPKGKQDDHKSVKFDLQANESLSRIHPNGVCIRLTKISPSEIKNRLAKIDADGNNNII